MPLTSKRGCLTHINLVIILFVQPIFSPVIGLYICSNAIVKSFNSIRARLSYSHTFLNTSTVNCPELSASPLITSDTPEIGHSTRSVANANPSKTFGETLLLLVWQESWGWSRKHCTAPLSTSSPTKVLFKSQLSSTSRTAPETFSVSFMWGNFSGSEDKFTKFNIPFCVQIESMPK